MVPTEELSRMLHVVKGPSVALYPSFPPQRPGGDGAHYAVYVRYDTAVAETKHKLSGLTEDRFGQWNAGNYGRGRMPSHLPRLAVFSIFLRFGRGHGY